MRIRYTGTKPVKKVDFNLNIYVFNPTCDFNELLDMDITKWLLHPDRAGLFVVDDIADKTPSQDHPEMTDIGGKEAKKKRGRRRKY